jgi:2-polyprenyl-3-methyl-5-hydroxy-6-metoxy-1,4-benzoquinol methylase
VGEGRGRVIDADDPFGPEISDLVVDYDPETLVRRPVRKAAVLERLEAAGRMRALWIARRIPEQGGLLVEAAVDRILVQSHLELQRLHEEFHNAHRLAVLLRPLVAAIRAAHPGRPIRVVDLGCGLGHVIRWLAAQGGLGDVTLVGADYNAGLVRAARRLAVKEGLACEFVTANAFRLDEPATIFTSMGVLHHFRGAALTRVFAEQDRSPALAMIHFDIRPSWAAPVGAFIFHEARMREPLARHDGYASALRAHPQAALRQALTDGAAGFAHWLYDAGVPFLPLLSIMHAAVAVRPALVDPFLAALGPERARLQGAS